jgi:hypothetical protein
MPLDVRRLNMSRRVLLIVSGLSVLAIALSAVTVLVVSVARLNLNSGIFTALVTTVVMGALAGFAAWILGMMQAARGRQWDWFVEVLVLGALGALIFAAVNGRVE